MEDKQNLYIGKEVDIQTGKLKDKYFYKTKDLSTHAVLIGMTGSGKTGMAIVNLEETILDGIPIIAIDPKGDLTNLLLTFPGLTTEEFKPWVDPMQAEQKGLSVDTYAENVAKCGGKVYPTGKSHRNESRSLKMLHILLFLRPVPLQECLLVPFRALKNPKQDLDGEETIEKIKGITSALLGLLGIQADPVKSREHILISSILQNAWQKGHDLTIEDLIMQVQKPPFRKLGVFSVGSFFPKQERTGLSMQINSLIASPAFQTWLQGEPLNIDNFIKKMASQEFRFSISLISQIRKGCFS